MTELDAARAKLHEATPTGWYAGTPSYHVGRREWSQYAFDARERAHIARRSLEWTAIGLTEEGVVREMARCLREITSGRVPR